MITVLIIAAIVIIIVYYTLNKHYVTPFNKFQNQLNEESVIVNRINRNLPRRWQT